MIVFENDHTVSPVYQSQMKLGIIPSLCLVKFLIYKGQSCPAVFSRMLYIDDNYLISPHNSQVSNLSMTWGLLFEEMTIPNQSPSHLRPREALLAKAKDYSTQQEAQVSGGCRSSLGNTEKSMNFRWTWWDIPQGVSKFEG